MITDPDRRLPYDLRRQFGLERHYINPVVITAYHWDHYQAFKYIYVRHFFPLLAARGSLTRYPQRHWLVQYWVKQIEEGHNVHKAVKTVGDRTQVYTWDGGLCHPVRLYSAQTTDNIAEISSMRRCFKGWELSLGNFFILELQSTSGSVGKKGGSWAR